jgi:alpha-L-arabinofuranosidase
MRQPSNACFVRISHHSGADIPVCPRECGRYGRQECLPHWTLCLHFTPCGEKCGLAVRILVVLGLVVSLTACVRADDAQLSVDATRTGAEISPYIYGQFIEHLGRCIHDGIWAEKLTDRKFLLEPGKKWEVVSPQGADAKVMLDTAGAYAGEHCMAVWVKDAKNGRCGIQQGDIGLVRGKEYVGYAYLAHVAKATPVDVRIAWGPQEADGKSIVLDRVGNTYDKYSFRFTAGATTDSARLSLTLSQPGYLWIGELSLMPADHVHGMRRDTLELIKKLHSPIIRWPGGNFVSGYDWKDGIGDRDRRPPRWERAWNDVEDNDFGIDEFMVFCREVKIEPLVVVNTGLGSVELAAEEVEYINGPATSRWGAVRAKNGHAQPYAVKWWGIGNEMFGNWQLGNVATEQYALRHNAFVKAMRRVDPGIQVVAVGAPGQWNDVFLAGSAEHVDLLSGHFYAERKLRLPFSAKDAKKYEERFEGYSACVLNGVRDIITDMRKRMGKDAKIDRIRLCIDEWGIVREWNPSPDDGGVGAYESYFCLGDAIAVARGLHEMLRSADLVKAAAWPQTVNVLGAVKTTRNDAAMDPVGHVLALYGTELGGTLVPLELPQNTPLDAVAAIDKKRGVLTIGLVNYSPRKAISLKLNLSGKAAWSAGWRIQGDALGDFNIPGKPEAVTLTPLDTATPDQPLNLPAHSITVVQFR